MIKIFIAFLIFAALSLFVLMKGGEIDMGGEKHGMDHAPAEAPATAAPPPASSGEQPK